MHITFMCYQLSHPYIYCSLYPKYNSPSPYISYIWWPDEGTFLWAKVGSCHPWTEVSMAFPNNEPTTSRDDWGGMSSNWLRKPVVSLMKIWPRCERYIYEEKNINREKFNETESGRTWITKDWRRGWIVRPPNTLSKRFSNKRKQPESEPFWV